MRRLASALLLTCAATGGIHAQTAGRDTTPLRALNLNDLGAPSFEAFTSRDGLPDAVITAIGVDAQGFAWATSARGLYRFVGHRWQAQTGPEFGRAHRRVTLDHTGTLWAPAMDGPLARYDGSEWQAAVLPGALNGSGIYRLAETQSPDGRVRTWLLSVNAGLHELRDGVWMPDPGNATLPRTVLLATTTTTQLFGGPRQWLATGDQGLWYRPVGETVWRPYREHGLALSQVEDLWRDVDVDGEVLWVSVFGYGLWRLSSSGARVWSTRTGELRSDELYTLAGGKDADGTTTVWAASRAGLVRIRGTTAETFDRRHGLPSDKVRSTKLWRSPNGENVLWIATEGGVARAILGRHRWRTATLLGSGAIGVFAVLVEPDGRGGERLWAGSYQDGLGLYDGGNWQRFDKASGAIPDNDIRFVKRARDLDGFDALWVGTGAGHLLRVHAGPRFETVPGPWPHERDNSVLDILGRDVDGERELWISTRQTGIYRLRRGGWTSFELEGVSPGWRAVSLLEQRDTAGRSWIWSTSQDGLARFDGRRWELVRGVDGLPQRSMLGMSLWPDQKGRQVLWVGTTYDGLVRVDVTNPMAPRVLPTDGLPPPIDPTVYSALRDSRGRLYLSPTTVCNSSPPAPTVGKNVCSTARTEWCMRSATPTRSSSMPMTASGLER